VDDRLRPERWQRVVGQVIAFLATIQMGLCRSWGGRGEHSAPPRQSGLNGGVTRFGGREGALSHGVDEQSPTDLARGTWAP